MDLIRTSLAAACFGLAAAILVSCAGVSRVPVVAPAIPGASFAGNQACYECHTNLVRWFPSSPHARMHVERAASPGETGCEACHGPGSLHVAAGGGRGRYIVNPRQDPAACLTCHLDVRSAFSLPHHHPVLQGQMTCVACHDPHGMDIVKPAGGLAMARLNEACSPCHKEQARPWIFEHEAMRDGCTACHDPHGSLNAKLLLAPDANLCLRCHAQVQGPAVPSGEIVIGTVNHTLLLRQGTCWSSGCHTAVHGSDVNPHLMY